MAATASSGSNQTSHTTHFSINLPMSRSPPPSPWTQIVRGGDSGVVQDDLSPSVSAHEDPSLPPFSPSVSPPIDKDTPHNDPVGKKPAWNKPSRSSVDSGSVMGAESWPALSVSARVSSTKSSSSESLKSLSDGSSSMPPLQAAEAPLASTQKQSVGNASAEPNASSTSSDKHHVLGQKKPYKRNNSNISSSSNISNPSAPGNAAAPPLNSIPSRDQTHSQRNGSYGGANPQYRNAYRNRNGSAYPRGDGVHHQNHGNRRNYDHGNQNAYPQRNYGGRDVHMQPQRGLGVMRPHMLMGAPPSFPAGGSQYIGGPHLRPYSGPVLYPEYASAIYTTHPPPEPMAFVGQYPPQPFYYPAYDPMLFTSIVNQVDFYFSADNLCKDKYLRQHMNDEGWVPVSLIAGFRKLAELTNNVQIILDAVRSSTVVEVEGESIRRRGDWQKYVWPRDLWDPMGSAAVANQNATTLEAHMQKMKVWEGRNVEEGGEEGKGEVSASQVGPNPK